MNASGITLPQPLASVLTQCAPALFGAMHESVLRDLEPELSRVTLNGGETLFAAGDLADALYVVVFGRLRAVARRGDDERVLGEIGHGESVGEMALLSGEPRSATVSAVRDTELIKLRKSGFEHLIERHPAMMLELARLIIARNQRAGGACVQARPTAIAIVPLNAAAAAVDVAASFLRALPPACRILRVDSTRLHLEHALPAEWLAPDFDSRELAAWLHARELEHDYLVYAADPEPSAWTRLCLRQSDLVLLVGTGAAGDSDPRLRALIHPSITRAHLELVLLYDSSRQPPRNSAEWLGHLRVASHHHVDPQRPRDFERLVRMATGKARGLVLGGGGARGLAHIGVLRALEEANVPVDIVGGTSIGAVIGGQIAAGWDSARVHEETRRLFVQQGSLNDFTIPIVALLRGKRYIRVLESLFGDRQIEDLPLQYFCVSTNLTRSEVMVHRSGPLTKSVAASMAVPGLGPPIFDGRDVLVDGGVLNNLPIDIMRSLGRGPVIASSVSPWVVKRLDREYADLPSPWRVLFSRINPFGTPMRVPTIAGILMRSASLPRGSNEGDERRAADLLFEPPLARYKLLEWRSIDELIEIGYRSAVATLEKLRDSSTSRSTNLAG